MRFRLLIATIVVATSTLAAHADTFTYTYTGHDFTGATAPYTTSDFVSGSFTLAAPIAANQDFFTNFVQPLSFSFTDGVQTINNLTATSSQFKIGTDSSGAIDAWDIFLGINVGQTDKVIATSFNPVGLVGQDYGNNLVGSGTNYINPGTWTETVNPSAVPELSTFALLGSGILGLAGVARRRFLLP